LLVAFIPALLMLATFGLERLESALTRDAVSASDVDEILAKARQGSSDRPVRAAHDTTVDGAQRRRRDREGTVETLPTRLVEAGLPTRLHLTMRPNPQFQPTRHANRV
jgi:hypothetical protein